MIDKKEMKKGVCFLIESPFPHYAGGIENWLYNVTTRLSSDSRVVILSEQPYFFKESLYNLPDSLIVCNYKTIRKYKFIRMLMRFSLFYLIFSKWQVRNMKNKLSEVIVDYGISNIVALNTMNAARAVYSVKKQKDNILYICSSRGPHAQVISKNHPLISTYLHRFEIFNMQKADVVWTNGYDMRDYYEVFGVNSTVMKNGVEIRKFSEVTSSPYASSDKVIVSVATLIDIKCISELIEAFSIVVREGACNCLLYFVGKGDQTKYKELAGRLNVADKVIFVGHKADVRPYLQHADVIACLSGGGGFSMAALEAMSSNTPIIAWDTPVYRQFILQSKTMELVKEKDVKMLSEKIIDIISFPEKYNDMRKNALLVANGFDWQVIVNEIRKALK